MSSSSKRRRILYCIGMIAMIVLLGVTPMFSNVQAIVIDQSDIENFATEASVRAVIETAAGSIATHAHASALIDVDSGRLLLSHNGDKRMLIASLTKVMTAIVAIENGNIADKVKVSNRAVGKEGSSIYLRLNEEMSLEHMLYGLMLRSGNDAATAIAEHVGGSEEGFAIMMNEKARDIGMKNSNFVNPHGLNADNHYSTANDMALLTAYALKNPVFSDIVKTKVKKVPNPHEKWQYTWYNKNKMLSFYEGADGVKTGFTKLAGRCLISSATRDGRQIAVVTLNDGNDWFDHTQWLNYGFSAYSKHTLIQKGDPIAGAQFVDPHSNGSQISGSHMDGSQISGSHMDGSQFVRSKTDDIPYVAGTTFTYPLTDDERQQIKTTATRIEPNTVHYKLGERGLLHFWLDDIKIGTVPLFEEGSPQLRLKHQSTFSNIGSQHHTWSKQRYIEILQSVFKALVNG